MERFTNAGLSFEVTDTGAGQLAVLLHGFPEDRHCWDAVMSSLAGYRMLAPDQRGYSPGASPAARRAYTLPHLAADVLALAGAERFHVVGHDWGAAVAWYLAAHHPDRVASLTALSVPHPEAFLRGLSLRSWYMAAFQVPVLPEWILARGVLRKALIRTGLDPVVANRYAARTALRGPLNWYRALPFGARDRVGRITVPTLFVWGSEDRFIPRAAAELCGRWVDGPYRFEELIGASHWLPTEAPDRLATLLAERWAL